VVTEHPPQRGPNVFVDSEFLTRYVEDKVTTPERRAKRRTMSIKDLEAVFKASVAETFS
jgi:hypothetical protein